MTSDLSSYYAMENAAAWGLYVFPETRRFWAEGRRLAQAAQAQARAAGQAYIERARAAGKE